MNQKIKIGIAFAAGIIVQNCIIKRYVQTPTFKARWKERFEEKYDGPFDVRLDEIFDFKHGKESS